MNKQELLQKLEMADPYIGFVQKVNPPAWGLHSDSTVFPFLIEKIRPKTIIEVGSWLGASAVHMAQRTKQFGLDTGIICIDTWLGSLEHWRGKEDRLQLELKNGYPTFYENFLSNVLRLKCEDVILPLPMPSLIAAKFLKEKNIMADMVYIDASHDELDVYNDLNAYWDLITPGGALFGDDWTWPSVVNAVTRFCGEKNVPFQHDAINWIIQK